MERRRSRYPHPEAGQGGVREAAVTGKVLPPHLLFSDSVSRTGCSGAKSRGSVSAIGGRGASLHWFPALWQHIECQRVTVGVLIAFQYCHWRQHMPDTVIVEDVTLTAFAHREAIHFVLAIVGYDDFATLSAAAAH